MWGPKLKLLSSTTKRVEAQPSVGGESRSHLSPIILDAVLFINALNMFDGINLQTSTYFLF